MRNRMYGGVRGRKTKVGEKLLRFPPTRFTTKNKNIGDINYGNEGHFEQNVEPRGTFS